MARVSDLEIILKHYWGYPAFRPLQKEIITAALEGNDVLAILPTGGGKSICYQVAGLATQKLCIVISPLIALMKDQVEQLQRRNIAATYINSTLSPEEIQKRLNNALQGKYAFLYCAPERLQTESFLQLLPQLSVGLIAVDEAHCISQWGHDFRPSYRKIAVLREVLKDVPIMALTASATPQVQRDICEQLQMKQPKVFIKTFTRPNLRYSVLYEQNRLQKMVEILEKVPGSAIVYVRSRRATQQLSQTLRHYGFSVAAYHAGLSSLMRNAIQEQWLKDQIRIMVATNAFGMGIDKPDVRTVIHWDLPPDLESYYQEAGRAGRDGKVAFPVLLYHAQLKRKAWKQWQERYPQWDVFVRCYQALCDLFQVDAKTFPKQPLPIPWEAWKKRSKASITQLFHVLKRLDQQGIIALSDELESLQAQVQLSLTPQNLERFIKKYPEHQGVLSTLLRQFGGTLFHTPAKFLLEKVATSIGISEQALHDTLVYLAQLGVLRYEPPTNTYTFQFLLPRQRLTKALLNWEEFLFLKEQAKQRLQAMIVYAEDKTRCRSQSIAQYFGENAEVCGKCDVCSGRHTSKIANTSSLRFEDFIITLQRSPTLSHLLSHYTAQEQKQVKKWLRHLLDEEKIAITEEGYIKLLQSF